MGKQKLSAAYHRILDDPFPSNFELTFVEKQERQTLFYEKVQWVIEGEKKGLRYGENPDQPAALYRLINGNIVLGDVSTINPGRYLASDIELLQSGKHPGKINITDVDSALNFLRYLDDTPCTAIIKHNNPCGVAKAETLAESYSKALMADRIAAFGGAVAVNREMDRETASLIAESYVEVVSAPEYAEGAIDILTNRKNLRIMKIGNMAKLKQFQGSRFIDFKSLVDGGLILQWSYVPTAITKESFSLAETVHRGTTHKIRREPTASEYEDMVFGWIVESGVTSNSVLYVKDGTTVGIGTGEQDRVGVAEIAKFKAYRNLSDRLCWAEYKIPWTQLSDDNQRKEIQQEVKKLNGGLRGSVMISDAFFPFRDGVDIGLEEGVSAVVQPGGSLRDYEIIEACNERNATMVFTGQRSFRH